MARREIIKQVEVFTTNIQDQVQAENVLKILENSFHDLKINFDLDDIGSSSLCSNTILRVEGTMIYTEKIIKTVNLAGFLCNILEDKICK